MKKAYALMATLFVVSVVQAATPLERIKSAAQSLQSDIQCIRTNTCTEAQKQRIKRRLGVILGTAAAGAVTIGAAVGTGVGLYKLRGNEQALLNNIKGLAPVAQLYSMRKTMEAEADLDEAITAINRQLDQMSELSEKAKQAIKNAIDRLPEFPGRVDLMNRFYTMMEES